MDFKISKQRHSRKEEGCGWMLDDQVNTWLPCPFFFFFSFSFSSASFFSFSLSLYAYYLMSQISLPDVPTKVPTVPTVNYGPVGADWA
jgi:hypothetical protein